MTDTTPNIFPVLRYRDARAAIEWLVNAFGFERLMVMEGPDGTIGHAELKLGPGVIMIGSERDGGQGQAGQGSLYVAIDDVDAHHERAKAAGAEVGALRDEDYGSREYTVSDLEGNVWSFGTYRPSVS
jgi:uncharacterized glyoxalase superfamily protein PhnB